MTWFKLAFGFTFFWVLLESGRTVATGAPFNLAAAMWALAVLGFLGLTIKRDE
jgi:hypothetical protein